MLVDPQTNTILAVIDWTDICIGPLEREFAVWEWRHDGELEKVIKVYEEKTGTKVNIRQARLWKYIETVNDLVEATETSELQKVDNCIDQIKQWATISN
jgi:aminoglycoside phosphotransferase (APT) family kinase protein